MAKRLPTPILRRVPIVYSTDWSAQQHLPYNNRDFKPIEFERAYKYKVYDALPAAVYDRTPINVDRGLNRALKLTRSVSVHNQDDEDEDEVSIFHSLPRLKSAHIT